MRASRASAASRAHLCAPAISLLTSTSATPPCTIASASLTFWQHTPTAPSAIWRRPITGDLWVLACGRRRTPICFARSANRARLRSKASRSSSRAGVSTSARGMPISAGGETFIPGSSSLQHHLLVDEVRQKCRDVGEDTEDDDRSHHQDDEGEG